MNSITLKDYRVTDRGFKISKFATKIKGVSRDDSEYQAKIADLKMCMSHLQDRLYASSRNSVLFIFQGIDASGKDGSIKHVMSGLNPQGCQVQSFKQPSAEELKHDFLWRHDRVLPERGKIGVWNRSHYEEVLVARVHPEILQQRNICLKRANDKFWERRYEQIVSWENFQAENGMLIIKFFLHISKKEQARRIIDRVRDDNKNWKVADSDFSERKFWDAYTDAYEKAISATASKIAPWYVIPADEKPAAWLLISEAIIHHLDKLDLALPKIKKEKRAVLLKMARALERELKL